MLFKRFNEKHQILYRSSVILRDRRLSCIKSRYWDGFIQLIVRFTKITLFGAFGRPLIIALLSGLELIYSSLFSDGIVLDVDMDPEGPASPNHSAVRQ